MNATRTLSPPLAAPVALFNHALQRPVVALWLLWLGAPLVFLAAYLGAASLVFDFGSAAFPNDEENTGDGRPVALGPRPRQLFCPPTWEGVCWEGREWPFVIFAPICSWWRDRHGYAPAAESRRCRITDTLSPNRRHASPLRARLQFVRAFYAQRCSAAAVANSVAGGPQSIPPTLLIP